MEDEKDHGEEEQARKGCKLKRHEVLTKHLKGRETEWPTVAEKPGPLQLTHLPIDILGGIVKEITHTNDLTSLALTHSALHNVVIPVIYSRFDIVWPDAHAPTETRTGVDALTYGLSTLVMSKEVFEDGPVPHSTAAIHKCSQCGYLEHCSHSARPSTISSCVPTRNGNNYAQYTRKFSLGNGPTEWVQEYLITKESGKMLGTLVALGEYRILVIVLIKACDDLPPSS